MGEGFVKDRIGDAKNIAPMAKNLIFGKLMLKILHQWQKVLLVD